MDGNEPSLKVERHIHWLGALSANGPGITPPPRLLQHAKASLVFTLSYDKYIVLTFEKVIVVIIDKLVSLKRCTSFSVILVVVILVG